MSESKKNPPSKKTPPKFPAAKNKKPNNSGPGQMDPKKIIKGPFSWIAIFLVFLAIFGWNFVSPEYKTIDTSYGIELLQGKTLQRAEIIDGIQKVRLELSQNVVKDKKDLGKKIEFFYVIGQATEIATKVEAANPPKGFNSDVPQESFLTSILTMIIPFVIIMAIFLFVSNKMQGGQNGPGGVFGFGKSKAKMTTGDKVKTKFSDVAGADEAVEELEEIKEFLVDPKKFTKLGAKIPKGVLLYGPPGTGKTLIARAVAGEANAPFFSMSGSDFVEMFVGVGASRVRDLFEKAKQNAPAIIFVDEIDAVGRHRGSGMGGGHDEREQTLNQLLVEMDGFDEGNNVITIAATNRPDILDPALLRPGRFDRQIAVEAPDLKGREAILNIHAKGKPLAKDIDFNYLAKKTPGFTGADLANVLNESALLAARLGKKEIHASDIDEAIDRVMAGPQKRSRRMSPDEIRNTAYHEAGHALTAAAMNYSDPVTKITILPRGRALGYTSVMPTEDRYSISRNQLLDQMAYAMGGRVAEEIVFHDPTTGASNDIEKATSIARRMVTEFGMTSKLGAVLLGRDPSSPMYGMPGVQTQGVSEVTNSQIDAQIKEIIENAHNESYKVLMDNRKILDTLAAELLEKETLEEKDLASIFKGVKKLRKRPTWLSSIKRPVSKEPPVKSPEDKREK